MRHIIIGDVHGCINELKSLIEKLQLEAEDKLYFIGDLIDKGPDSVGVVKLVRELSKRYPLILILGNHEEKFLRYVHHKEHNPKAIATMVGTEKFEGYLKSLDQIDIEFLASSYINYNITSEQINLLHGGIVLHNSIDLSINHKYSHELLKSTKGFELLLKTRFLDSNGNFIGLGKETGTSVFWADMYDGRYGKVIFGHEAKVVEFPIEYKYATNIDTGCVFGGWLNALVILPNKSKTYVCTKAEKVYTIKK